MSRVFTNKVYIVLVFLTISTIAFAQVNEEITGELKTLQGEIIQIDHDNKSFIVKHYLHPKGLMYAEEVYERTTCFVNNLTMYTKGSLLHDYYDLQDGDIVTVQYKFIPKTGENLVIRINRK